MVYNSLKAADMLEEEGLSVKVVDMHTIKPLDEELVLKAAKETGCIVTSEEHSIIGGLGSAVCDVLSEKCPTPVFKIGMRDVFGESGSAAQLLHKYLLDAEGIYDQVKKFVKQ